MHWATIFLTLVASSNQIYYIHGKRTDDDYLDYDSEEEDILSDHAYHEPRYIREIEKYRKLGIDYDLKPMPVTVYYPVPIHKPYYSKKYSYPYNSNYKPYKYFKKGPDYDKEYKKKERKPSNESESSSPSKLASSYRNRGYDDEYSRPFPLRSRVIDDHPHPIPFKDQDPEFTTPPPLPPPPPQKGRQPSTSSPSGSKRTTSYTKESPGRHGYHKAEATTPHLPTKQSIKTSEGNSPRVHYRYRDRQLTKSPPRRYQQIPANSKDERTYRSPNQGRSQLYTSKKPRTTRPRQFQQKSYSESDNSRSRSHQEPSVSRKRSETISKEPHHQRNDKMATKLGFGNFKGSFSDLVKYDSPFAKESNGKRKDSFIKHTPTTPPRKENQKELEEEQESSVRSHPPTRHAQTKVHYDDDDDGDADGKSYQPNQSRDNVYKKYEERVPSGQNQHSQQPNYKPNNYHSSTPSTGTDPHYRSSSYSSPPATKKYEEHRERTYREHSPREERDHQDRPAPQSSTDDDNYEGSKGKLIPRKYVPTKRYYDREEDSRETDSVEDSSEEDVPREQIETSRNKERHRNKRHSIKPQSWQRVINESRITTISSSNPSVLKIFKAMKFGKSNEDVVLFDTRVSKDKTGQIRQIITKSIPFALRINESDVPTCARNNNLDYCTMDSEYPREIVLEALQKNSDQWRSLLNIHPGSENIQRRFIVQNGTSSGGCTSINTWITPLRAKDADGTWRVIANVNEFKQSVSLEICSKQNEACNTHENAICKQQKVERQLVTLSGNNGLSLERFQFPSSCSCSIA